MANAVEVAAQAGYDIWAHGGTVADAVRMAAEKAVEGYAAAIAAMRDRDINGWSFEEADALTAATDTSVVLRQPQMAAEERGLAPSCSSRSEPAEPAGNDVG